MTINEFNEYKIKDTTLYKSSTYEVLIKYESSGPIYRRHSEIFELEDASNGITYSIDGPSDNYILYVLSELKNDGLFKEFRRRYLHMPPLYREKIEEIDNIFDLLRLIFRRIHTLKIVTESHCPLDRFKKYYTSISFHIAYNLELPFIEIKSLEEYINIERMHKLRNNSSEEIEPPRRTYTEDLVYHYQMGIASESPYLKFISFYHIIEHFMESIYEEELINSIQTEITKPSFSIKRKKDVKKLISLINKKLKVKSEEMIINEREAVRLTLIKYIDIKEINKNLNLFDTSLLNYYKQSQVHFSKGKTVDLQSNNREQVIRDLTHRIYETRNAIVHSKDSEKPKYIPFKHDKYLTKEIPLIRLISEQIIIGDSDLL